MFCISDLGQAVGADGELLARGGGNGAYSGISLGDLLILIVVPSLTLIHLYGW